MADNKVCNPELAIMDDCRDEKSYGKNPMVACVLAHGSYYNYDKCATYTNEIRYNHEKNMVATQPKNVKIDDMDKDSHWREN